MSANLLLLRQAAQAARTKAVLDRASGDAHAEVHDAVADWLDDSARKWEINFRATQSPSPGYDVPPGLHFGNPGGASKSADHHARHALAVARAYLGGTP